MSDYSGQLVAIIYFNLDKKKFHEHPSLWTRACQVTKEILKKGRR